VHSSSTNTDAPILYNPKRARYRLLGEQGQHAPNSGFGRNMGLVDEPEHDDACELGWRVSKDVGKVQVQCDEGPLLAIAHVNDPFVRLTTKSLLNDGMSIVPSGCKYRRQCWRKILVELEFHAALVSTMRSRASLPYVASGIAAGFRPGIGLQQGYPAPQTP
jgi:hypothetical protein